MAKCKPQSIDFDKKSKFVIDGSPSSWLECAEELMSAAELIWDNNEGSLKSEINGPLLKNGKVQITQSRKISSISRPYFLLTGFAIENILKGFIVFNDPTTITDGTIKRIKSHKILNLVQQINEIKLTEKEKNICEMIEGAIPYWGRYPIPLECSAITPDIGITPEIKQTIKVLYDRIAFQLYIKLTNGWDSGTGEGNINIYIARFETQN